MHEITSFDYQEVQKTGARPSNLSIPPPKSPGDESFEVDPSSTDVICGLRAKLDRQEALWTAEKATLEEFYEVNSRTLQETVCQLRDACHALRHENDGQLQLLQSSRRALSDLRNRYDLGVASWNEERERLLLSTGQVRHSSPLAMSVRRRFSLSLGLWEDGVVGERQWVARPTKNYVCYIFSSWRKAANLQRHESISDCYLLFPFNNFSSVHRSTWAWRGRSMT